ncbi:MAG: DUF3817 domain-containing protein [Bacteroidetes bacterium]|nr:DUF3817 domain-containing protein [Bacteroidota bacterium]HET6244330.1 DUF3817 domain-containing protein [Bacteroidia bacterium]
MKFEFSNTSIGRFRLIALLEGISFLLLLFIAMPLKYYADIPLAVKYTGWIHGILFVLYLAALTHVFFANKWSLLKGILAVLASLVPFGPFLLDRKHSQEENIILKQNQD